ncbi:hypothetical protein FBU59_000291 [Linderina macrospora]|uniref:Uncharacterized protein n=1 Tax=Linderina macrospora TaxID=4868 RepID=A0ACC1JH91_9FUNG|nr:hypothetical protein FBU59_000291 [Linderina macrospora]
MFTDVHFDSANTASSSSSFDQHSETVCADYSSELEYQQPSGASGLKFEPTVTGRSSSGTVNTAVREQEMVDLLSRAHAWRLDSQCASLRPQQQRMLELGDILHKASRLTAHRLTNQDYTPPALQRMERLERVACDLDEMSEQDRRIEQRTFMTSVRSREMFLVGIAGKLGRVDGKTALEPRGRAYTEGSDEEGEEGEQALDRQRAVHPREHMRRFVQKSIERLNSIGRPLDDQRFVSTAKQSSAWRHSDSR